MERLLLAVLSLSVAHGFCLPGVAPQDYARDDIVNLKVNKLSSTKTQLPYEYYSLPYCRPDPIVNSAENLGEVLRGDRIENSLYQIEIRLDEQCKVRALCFTPSSPLSRATPFFSSPSGGGAGALPLALQPRTRCVRERW